MRISIVVRFSDSGAQSTQHPDLKLPLSINFDRDDVNKLINASWLKLMVRQHVEGTARRRLRLIYNGRILNDETNFRSEVFEPKLRQIQTASDSRDSESAKDNTKDNQPLSVYVHCLIGDEMTAAQLAEEKELDRRSSSNGIEPPVIGFDRLLSQGMSASDVDDLRRQFQQIYFPDGIQNSTTSSGVADVEEEEQRQQFVRELEERWLESTNGNGGNMGASGRTATQARNPSRGTNASTGISADGDAGGQANLAERAAAELEGAHHNENLLVGLLLGTFLGAVALVFLLMDDSSFNDAQKMAMVLGISINLFIAFMRVGTEYSA
ncbi:hypothetical protein JCM33374_g1447 [Metschnikowia sp. JCM 33374]|nr:hypothetical protein JCM33374_g1447 [Metschnikowia sp. JCM 33374]